MSRSSWTRLQLRLAKRLGLHHPNSARPENRPSLFLERLESRDLLATAVFQPTYVLLQPAAGGSSAPFLGSGPSGTTPAQIRHAYGFDQLSFGNGTIPAD